MALWHLLPVFLYAETHYRFKYFFSFLRKHEPEILADAPHRLDPQIPLPLLVLIKDAHLFPTLLKKVSVVLRIENMIVLETTLLEAPLEISEKVWWRVYDIPLNGLTGKIKCDVQFEISDGKNARRYFNDNYRTSSHFPLDVYVSESCNPKFGHLYFGECHSHSIYSNDQVEFGSPLGAAVNLSMALGLSFLCVTDHSYDLDDSLDSYLINDPKIQKWQLLQNEVDDLNSKSDQFVIVRGEEVTCRTQARKNIHLLLLGNRKFFHGSGDGAEHWLKTESEHSITEVLNDLEPSAVSYAAHPLEPVSSLQRILLGRGVWLNSDLLHQRLSGLQFINGQLSDGFWNGYRQWIEELLKGRRLFALAGNDAHGNFNRFRQIGIPFLRILEREHQVFGKMRTGVFLESLSESNILSALKYGQSLVTDGPVINFIVYSGKEKITSIGSNNFGNNHKILLDILSSTEYGSIHLVKIFKGIIGSSEIVILSEHDLRAYAINRELEINIETNCYLRAEVWTSADDSSDAHSHFCFTNPVWFIPEIS